MKVELTTYEEPPRVHGLCNVSDIVNVSARVHRLCNVSDQGSNLKGKVPFHFEELWEIEPFTVDM